MTTEYELTYQDYLLIIRRSMPKLIGAFVTVLLISTIVTFALPPVYRSTGTILVESPPPDKNYVEKGAVNSIEEQISTIEDRVLTRDSLLLISSKYKLFHNDAGSMTTTELIDKMRDRITVELVDTDPNIDKSVKKSTDNKPVVIAPLATAAAFRLSYDDPRPEIAYGVAKDLVTLVLDWNVKLRTEKATETSRFLSDESDKLKAELDRLNGKIADFKRQNNNYLPEQMTVRTTMLGRAETDLYEIEREIQTTNDNLRSAQAELSVAKNSMGDQPSQELPKLRTEYAKLSAIYTDSHPDVKALKRKIETLENANKAAAESTNLPASAPNQTATVDKTVTLLQAKVDSFQARLASLTKHKADLQSNVAQSEQILGQSPRVGEDLEVLTRDRDNAQKKYEEVYSKKTNAQMSTSLENENIGERFTLIEPPIKPDEIYKPNRVKVFLVGLFLAIATPGGMVMAMGTFGSQVYGVDALAHVLGRRPLVVIPYLYIREEQEEERRKKRKLKMAIIAVTTLIVIALAINFLFMPLDDLFAKIFGRG